MILVFLDTGGLSISISIHTFTQIRFPGSTNCLLLAVTVWCPSISLFRQLTVAATCSWFATELSSGQHHAVIWWTRVDADLLELNWMKPELSDGMLWRDHCAAVTCSLRCWLGRCRFKARTGKTRWQWFSSESPSLGCLDCIAARGTSARCSLLWCGLSVSLYVGHIDVATAEPIELLFGMWIWVGPRNHVLDGELVL